MTEKFAHGPLTGVKLLDLTGVIMGPFGTHILADLGADVIKVESPEGDVLRNYRPLRTHGMSGQVMHLHRNKRSIVLDLKSPEGADALRTLISQADVLVHNMRPKAIERLGFGYAAVQKLNPQLIYCGAYGFGVGGVYSDKAAYDDMIQACCGLADLAGQIHGEPAYAATVVCDKLAGQAIAYAVSAALYQRAMGGGGQEVEVPMFETSIEFMLIEHFGGGAFVPPIGGIGFHRVLNRFRKPFRTLDGHVCILPYSDRNWDDFFDFTGHQDFKGDPRYRTHADRAQQVEVLYTLIEREAARRTTSEWVDFCDGVSIPCMPVLSLNRMHEDPHVKSVGLFEVGEHPTEGSYRVVRAPVRFGKAPFQVRRHAPRLGENTREVLAEAGLTAEQIDQLQGAQGAAVTP
ncbi:CaiB/BaiF CoA transferase family protein [Hydrogenophaga sp.]|jgi:crotonobetainyl-CoA:carnitine CoA-transferase CaiB-like acyl-CoA transferase|uniref:CaiB/BaiF CoA transferase family protein n=1 Tax=Hydrogenophaga sp. TaxID=1904254 RepID=UPI003F706E34